MYIFYDFETSSRDLVGQILTYAFVVTDAQFNPVQQFTGRIKCNRVQCPEVGAILTNKIRMSELQSEGKSEYESAKEIKVFLDNCISQYGNCILVGYNSNQFDLSFLRTLFIRYGLNPYFRGKLKNIDILHWVQYLGFYFPENFPWVTYQDEEKAYYSFKLEELTHATGLLTEAQSHDALEDVLLTIKLVALLEKTFGEAFKEFKPVDMSVLQGGAGLRLVRQRQRHFANAGETPQKFQYRYLMPLVNEAKTVLFVDLNRALSLMNESDWQDEDKSRCIQYVNPNKAFFIIEDDDRDVESFDSMMEIIEADPFFQGIKQNPSRYFDLIKKDWDIEFQIHELGFERIDQLDVLVQRFLQDPDQYQSMLQTLLQKRTEAKDNYLIQLFNRLYLNYHPKPDPAFLKRYLQPRYIDGLLSKDKDNPYSFHKNYTELLETLESGINAKGAEISESDIAILQDLKQYYEDFARSLEHCDLQWKDTVTA